MKSNSEPRQIEQRTFEWELLGKLRELERHLRKEGLEEEATWAGEIASLAGKKYHQTASDLRRAKHLGRHLPRSLAGVSLDHPIFGGRIPTRVNLERRPVGNESSDAEDGS